MSFLVAMDSGGVASGAGEVWWRFVAVARGRARVVHSHRYRVSCLAALDSGGVASGSDNRGGRNLGGGGEDPAASRLYPQQSSVFAQ